MILQKTYHFQKKLDDVKIIVKKIMPKIMHNLVLSVEFQKLYRKNTVK